MAFKIAASMALKNAASKCNPVILEPMMKVEVVIPEEYLGDIMGQITSRRGRVEGMEARGNAQVVRVNGSTFRNVWLCNITSFKYTRSWSILNAL